LLKTGLVSVTFRQLSAPEIAIIAVEAGLDAIEWGGDIHVPHGDILTAKKVAAITRSSGLKVACYGSYYVAGKDAELPFEKVLETAVALDAPMIRIWAGDRGSADSSESYRSLIVEESRRVAGLAESAGLSVTYEFHSQTLTDTAESAIQLLHAVNHPSLRTQWQPPLGMSAQECIQSLERILPWLADIHIFHWGETPGVRYPLTHGEDSWKRYIRAAESPERDRYMLLEFVEDDEPAALLRDAVALHTWLNVAQGV
jgi:sugar phosphate isomerase/epimerase